jgi:hypothetical protein
VSKISIANLKGELPVPQSILSRAPSEALADLMTRKTFARRDAHTELHPVHVEAGKRSKSHLEMVILKDGVLREIYRRTDSHLNRPLTTKLCGVVEPQPSTKIDETIERRIGAAERVIHPAQVF